MKNLFCCLSVCGGWQTALVLDNHAFGPVFNRINDLWAWQAENLFKATA